MKVTSGSTRELIGFLIFAGLLLGTGTVWGSESILEYGRFGKLTLYQTSPQPNHVVLFVSGDGGWNLGVIDMAQSLAGLDALVVGIDITHYLRELGRSSEKCSYPAADFENLSKFVQKKLGFEQYRTPVLVGYSSGATLAYATLVQAPQGTFRGAISLGFCPDLPLNKPFCKGNGLAFDAGPGGKGFNFLPAAELKSPWIAFQGTIDQVCDAGAVETYVKKVGSAEAVLLPKVGHGFSVQKNWLPQFREAFNRLVQPDATSQTSDSPDSEVTDLPLIEIPATGPGTDLLAVILSGDGGWASIDRDIGAALAAKGVSVVGLDTLQYFWTARSPDLAAKDLERILRHYLNVGKQKRILLIGYSLGADVLPFLAARLPENLQAKVATVALLNPAQTANFEFHLSDWISGDSPGALPIAPEITRFKQMKLLCLYGTDEKDSLCRGLKSSALVNNVSLGGGHHFGGDYQKLVDLIFTEINPK